MTDNKRSKRLLWQIPLLAVLIAGTVLIIRQQQSMPYQHDSGFVFGTVYNITYQHETNMKAEIEAELRKVDRSLSTFNKQSVISSINRNERVRVDDMFRRVFTLAESVSRETDGAFDITVAPLVNAWGFGFKSGITPDRHRIDSLLHITGYKKVKLAGDYVQKADPRIMLDCNAIAKGYGCDVVADFLRTGVCGTS